MDATIEHLRQYPITGLMGHDLSAVTFVPASGFPLDRITGFATSDSGFDPLAPKPVSKDKFHVLANDPRLALLKTTYDPATGRLDIVGPDTAKYYDLNTNAGRATACDDLCRFLDVSPTSRRPYSLPRRIGSPPFRYRRSK